MSFATANTVIFDAINITGTVVTPDIRNRETQIPAVLFGLEDSGPTNDTTGSIGPYHSRYVFACLSTSRILADALAAEVLADLAASASFVSVHESSRSAEIFQRGADTVPVYVTELTTTLTFAS
tara:strand:- start:933 stop:1304 length:372 start_codon:yes stop_codon:yes gene_type:complete